METTLAFLGTAVLSILVTALVVSALHSKRVAKSSNRIARLEAEINDHQKQIHRLEASHLKARNDLELEHHETLKRVKEEHYSEGYQHGIAASQKDHLVELTNAKALHRDELARCEAEAEQRGRAVAKLEHEAQVKAFGVEIRPYVKIEKDVGMIWDSHKSYTGYQYQLLVNGIPAFQPHVVVEHAEEIKAVDKETVAELLKLAHKAADLAAKAYTGGAAPGALTIGPEIVQHIKV